MGLLEDAKRKVSEAFGPEVAGQLDGFDRPDRYPREFLEECVDFIGKLMGEDAARRKFMPLAKKYLGSAGSAGGNHGAGHRGKRRGTAMTCSHPLHAISRLQAGFIISALF